MFLRMIALAVSLAAAAPAGADQADELLDAMGVPEIVEVMREEGLDYGAQLSRDLLGKPPSPGWRAEVDRIYDTDEMERIVRARFDDALGDTDVTPLLEFFESPVGQRIVELELEARRAMTDDEVEQAARDAYRSIAGTDAPKLARLRPFVEANDLIAANVAGALNSSYQFYRGLVDGGGFEMSEEAIISEVWNQEEATRTDTREWLYAFLMLAYGPLGDDVLGRYVDLSATPAGRAMNRALFAGFDEMYGEISYELGLGLARQMQGRDL